MLEEIINLSLHHDSLGDRKAKTKLFNSLHSLLAMKNTATGTCVLTARNLAVKVCVIPTFYFFIQPGYQAGRLTCKQILASRPKQKLLGGNVQAV